MISRKLSKDIGDTYLAAFMLADGNIGAHNVLYGFAKHLENFQYENRYNMQKSILKKFEVLDRFRLHADRFWDFYKDICKTSYDNLFAFTHAYIDRDRYVGVAAKLNEWYDNNMPFDFDKLFSEVKSTDPQYFEGFEMAEVQEIEGEITPDLLNSLKSRFNQK